MYRLDDGLKNLIDLGKDQGYLTFSQVNTYLPDGYTPHEKEMVLDMDGHYSLYFRAIQNAKNVNTTLRACNKIEVNNNTKTSGELHLWIKSNYNNKVAFNKALVWLSPTKAFHCFSIQFSQHPGIPHRKRHLWCRCCGVHWLRL